MNQHLYEEYYKKAREERAKMVAQFFRKIFKKDKNVGESS